MNEGLMSRHFARKEELERAEHKDPVTGEKAEHLPHHLSLDDIKHNKREQAFFYNIFLYRRNPEKATKIVEAMKDKKNLDDEDYKHLHLEEFRHEALEDYNKIRTEVELVKAHITPELISLVGERHEGLAKIIHQVHANKAAELLKSHAIFEMAITNKEKFDDLKKNMHKVHEKLGGKKTKKLDAKIKELTAKLGISEEKLNEATAPGEKSLWKVQANLRKAALEKYKGWEKVEQWFKTFSARSKILSAVAKEIRLVNTCEEQLHKIGELLVGTVNSTMRRQIYLYELDHREITEWPPQTLNTVDDLGAAIKEMSDKSLRRKWDAKEREYFNDHRGGGRKKGGGGGGKSNDDMRKEQAYVDMKDDFWDEQYKLHNKYSDEKLGVMHALYKDEYAGKKRGSKDEMAENIINPPKA